MDTTHPFTHVSKVLGVFELVHGMFKATADHTPNGCDRLGLGDTECFCVSHSF